VDIAACSTYAFAMHSPLHFLFSLSLAAVATGMAAPPKAQAQTASASDMAGEQCITYRREGNDAFRLVNSCEVALSVSVCAETAQSGGCGRDIGWQSLAVGPRADLPGSYAPLSVLSIIACKAPAVVFMQKGGQGSCDPTGTANLPLLLAASLKNASSIITSRDYPRNVRASGTTRFEMVVNTEGQPQSCTITLSAGNVELDKATCDAFMQRARFTPSKDASGQPIAGRYRGSVTWKEP
jgi:TonB family protein